MWVYWFCFGLGLCDLGWIGADALGWDVCWRILLVKIALSRHA